VTTTGSRQRCGSPVVARFGGSAPRTRERKTDVSALGSGGEQDPRKYACRALFRADVVRLT